MSSPEVIKVFVRVRPPLSNEVQYGTAVEVASDGSILVKSDKHDIKCSYNHVFADTSEQNEVFASIQPLLDDVLSGVNGCIFAYGQTGAGKTHTMLGPDGGQDVLSNPSEWGILPRAAKYLFSTLVEYSNENSIKYNVKASFLQIYNERLYDLLRDSALNHHTASGMETELKIRELQSNQQSNKSRKPAAKGYIKPCEVYVSGLSEFRVHTAEDVLKILAIGTLNRTTRGTDLNASSSRSHAVLQLNFEIENSNKNGQTVLCRSKLSLVDLAGSEKMHALNSDPSAKHLKELTSINQSLSALGNVISALSSHTNKKSNDRIHVPYRDSKLTRLLQDSLGGNTRTILIACISPSIIHVNETSTTLLFADRARNVLIKVKANMVIDDKMLLLNAQNEISRLKLLLKQALQKLENHGMNIDGSANIVHDGETTDEIERVLAENKKLRRENIILTKQLQIEQKYSTSNKRPQTSSIRHINVISSVVNSSTGVLGSNKRPEWNERFYDTSNKSSSKQGKRNRNKNNSNRHNIGHGSDSELNQSADSLVLPISLLPAINLNDSLSSADSPQKVPRKNDNSADSSAIENKKSTTNNSVSVNITKEGPLRSKSATVVSNITSSKDSSENIPNDSPGKGKVSGQVAASIAASRIQNAIKLQQEIGSPSKYNSKNSPRSTTKNVDTPIEEDEDDTSDQNDALNIAKLRDKLDKAKNSKDFKSIEKSLINATKLIDNKLEIETKRVDKIQNERLELERQLREMQSAEQADNSQQKLHEDITSANKKILAQMQRDSDRSISQALAEKSVSPTKLTVSQSNATQSFQTSGPAKQDNKGETSKTTNTTSKKEKIVTDQHPPAELSYSKLDIGRVVQMFAFRYNTWENVELCDYENSNQLHKCKLMDGSEKWLDLKKKPIRGLVIPNANS